MTLNILLSLIGIALTTSWTPGPNNSMLASSGATYGIRASLPHVFGVMLGFPVMIFLVGLGLGELFQTHPIMEQVLRYVGAAMMLWIAWKIANAAASGSAGAASRPMRFFEAAGFQWINPKGWLAAVAMTSQFVTPENPLITSLIISIVFFFTGLTSTFAWLSFGRSMGRFLNTTHKLRAFNIAMAVILIVFLVVLLLGR
ncbi:MAG: LysE family translocator [Rhodobacter sp.]|nr:LysE family translocator [Rhodobacter sp.]